jgi:hypothetical protein
MVGSKIILVGHLKQLGVKCAFLHCIIHQEALCGKLIKMNQTVEMVVNIVILFSEETKLKDTEHSLYSWKKWMLIMVIIPYILTSDG